MTLRERFVTALTARGHKRVDARTGKYLVFTSRIPDNFYFVGRSGALRFGRCATASVPVSDRHKACWACHRWQSWDSTNRETIGAG